MDARETGDAIETGIVIFLLCVFCCICGLLVGSTISTRKIHYEAIENNAAHYDAVTGEFTWN